MKRVFFGKKSYLSKKEREAFVAKWQDVCCAICGSQDRVVVDYDPATGVIRKLLCTPHNLGIRRFSNNADLLRKAADYLDAHPQAIAATHVTFTTEYEAKLIGKDLILALIQDQNFSSDRARGKVLAERTGCPIATAVSRIRRTRAKLLTTH